MKRVADRAHAVALVLGILEERGFDTRVVNANHVIVSEFDQWDRILRVFPAQDGVVHWKATDGRPVEPDINTEDRVREDDFTVIVSRWSDEKEADVFLVPTRDAVKMALAGELKHLKSGPRPVAQQGAIQVTSSRPSGGHCVTEVLLPHKEDTRSPRTVAWSPFRGNWENFKPNPR